MALRAALEERLDRLPQITARPTRDRRARAYFCGEQEVAHFHGDARVDVRLGRTEIARTKAGGGFDPRVKTRGPTADWVAVSLAATEDLDLAVDLVRTAARLAVARPT